MWVGVGGARLYRQEGWGGQLWLLGGQGALRCLCQLRLLELGALGLFFRVKAPRGPKGLCVS